VRRSFSAQLISRGWRDFRRGFAQFLTYDICFKVAGAAVLVPLSTWVLARLISSTGHLSISNAQVASFLLSPFGLATVVVSVTVALGLGFAELAGLVVMASRALAEQRVSALEALRLTAMRLPALLGLAALQAFLYVLALAPFAGLAGLVYLAMTQRYDINYLITARPPSFWLAVVIGAFLLAGALLVFAVLYLRWIFSVPALLFERASPLAALRSSRRLMSGNWHRVGFVLVLWALAMAAGPAIVTGALNLLGTIVFARLGENLTVVIGVIALLIVLYLLAIEIVTLVGLSINGHIIAHLYRRLSEERGMPVAALAAPQVGRFGRGVGWWKSRRAVAAFVLACLAVMFVASFAAVKRTRLDHHVEVTAHRGSSKRAPENTLSAIEAAIEDGADYCEIDVQETADGVIVVLHDEDLMRVAGVARKIWEISYAEIRELDAGSWFATSFAGERVPTLAEAIETARDRIKLNIELKFNGHDEMLAERVVQVLEDADFVSQSLVSSLDYAALLKVRELNPELETGYMIYSARGRVARLDVDFLSFNKRLATQRRVEDVQRTGKEVHVWTVDAPAEMSSYIDLGVDNITTNEPAILRAMIDEREALSEVEKLLLAFRSWARR
jgi:glycerophosphoryl diester phosphodiesterase